ncbi:hypothetical protein XELAEV_18043602mg [Xenopus laevis]|uniref:Uncharacterized protein n=1 Tax=Xenopus laevis TaxID=8355 RepID=A0A974BWX9_XENLA|nr:hypothetical protein XELAEV_18043602mg [Xenopus laevis]
MHKTIEPTPCAVHAARHTHTSKIQVFMGDVSLSCIVIVVCVFQIIPLFLLCGCPVWNIHFLLQDYKCYCQFYNRTKPNATIHCTQLLIHMQFFLLK